MLKAFTAAWLYRLVGAKRFLRCAMQTPATDAMARLDVCRTCPNAVAAHVGVWRFTRLVLTCGTPFQETPKTCGCVVGIVPLTIGRRIMRSSDDPARTAINAAMPLGKSMCEAESCPQERWAP